jgi:hypothetical protein
MSAMELHFIGRVGTCIIEFEAPAAGALAFGLPADMLNGATLRVIPSKGREFPAYPSPEYMLRQGEK